MSNGNGERADLSALSGLAPELAEMLVSVACDIAVVLDEVGVIHSVALGAVEPPGGNVEDWVGRRWSDTVAGDMRHIAEEFLHDLTSTGVSRRCELNHSSTTGAEIPFSYTAVRLGQQGPTLAVGRNMRAVVAMQQRLMHAQHEIERDYWQRRQAETRYRFLFQVAAEPLLILDETNFSVVDANRAAAVLLQQSVPQLFGKPIIDVVDPGDQIAMRRVLNAARASAGVAEGEIRLAHDIGKIGISVTSFHTDSAKVLLLRARSIDARIPQRNLVEAGMQAVFQGLVQRTSDAIVVTDLKGRVTFANDAFLELVESPRAVPIKGRDLSVWIAHDEMPVANILEMARSDDCARLIKARLLRRHNRVIDIEFSATSVPGADSVAFIIRVSHDQDSPCTPTPRREVH